MAHVSLRGHLGEAVDVEVDPSWHYPSVQPVRTFSLSDVEAAELNAATGGFEARFTTAKDGVRHHRRCHYVAVFFDDGDSTARPIAPAVLATGDSAQAWLWLAAAEAKTLDPQQPLRLQVDAAIEPELVLFDVDGTLVDSLPAYIEVGRLAAQAHGYSLSDQFVRDTMNRNNDAFWELVVAEHETDRDKIIASLRAEAKRHWPRLVESMVRPFASVDACIDALRRSSIKTGVVTASGGSSMAALSERTRERFDVVVTRHDVTAQKPAPDGILKAVEQLAADPARTVYVGDSIVDVQAALAAGVDCVAVNTGAGHAEDLAAAGPRRLISRLDALNDIIKTR